ncbi:DUF1642 domain-containing protein [Enterococcus asini]|uniref:DUF1642 domain-containing protein n=1 Tax=Enterococcus asini TaxID=57732 RepID=A0AAW8TTC9_9ENTE|nr:DUF1642 domain-containing protein [Enterococcus asini]MDT2809173.1 DUF1642 domain-containing protein [Enterococcus asini]
MKVSEAIDRLEVGDTVWVKGKVLDFDRGGYDHCPLELSLFYEDEWIHENDEISLTEPQPEKVEVPDYVAEWYEEHKYDLDNSIWACVSSITQFHSREIELNDFEKWFSDFNNEPIETLIRMKDGYTVKPKRWVVKNEKGYVAMENFKDFDNHKIGVKFTIVSEKSEGAYWDDIDRAKAEAVAVLVEGSVEEV